MSLQWEQPVPQVGKPRPTCGNDLSHQAEKRLNRWADCYLLTNTNLTNLTNYFSNNGLHGFNGFKSEHEICRRPTRNAVISLILRIFCAPAIFVQLTLLIVLPLGRLKASFRMLSLIRTIRAIRVRKIITAPANY